MNNKWKELKDIQGTTYDLVKVLDDLGQDPNSEDIWKDLWQRHIHQGDITEASYAAVIGLVTAHYQKITLDLENFYNLVGNILVASLDKNNPAPPDWVAEDFSQALKKLWELSLADIATDQSPITTRSILGVLAMFKKQYQLGAIMITSDESEIQEYVDEQLLWNETVDPARDI